MRLICPSCGAMHSLEGFLVDGDAREALASVASGLGQLADKAVRYVALFRQPGGKRGLSWPRAKKLFKELATLVLADDLQWNTKRILANSPEWWGEALDVVLDKAAAGKFRLPLTNHNLLRCIAYETADKAGEVALREREELLRHSPTRPEVPLNAQSARLSREQTQAHVSRILKRISGEEGGSNG